jgi:hypothetical protein
MRNFLGSYLFLITLIVSCSDNGDVAGPQEKANKYFPLQTGNYWIYKVIALDSTGNATGTETIDSVVVAGKLSINEGEYFKVETFRAGIKQKQEFWSTEDRHIYKIFNKRTMGYKDDGDTALIYSNFKAMEWIAGFYKDDTTDYEYNDMKGWATVEYKLAGTRDLLKEKVKINDTEYFSYSFKFKTDSRIIFHNDYTYWILTQLHQEYISYVEKIGPALIEIPAYYLLINYKKKEWRNGSRSRLIRYHIID